MEEEDAPELAPDTKEFVKELTDRLILICNELLPDDDELRPYQVELARRIFESLILDDSATVTACFARQSGKTETLSLVTVVSMIFFPSLARMFPDWMRKYKDGFKVGAFAPVDEQADNLYDRIRERLTSEHAYAIMADPDLNDFPVVRGRQAKLRNGSLVRKTTCHPKATIEGRTYHLILIDEAQGADKVVVDKKIAPMGAATNATMVMTGTPAYTKGVFYDTIRINKRNEARGYRKSNFEFDWKTVAKYNPQYKKKIEGVNGERNRLGEDSDEFKLCISPEAKVLTADLRHVPAGSLHPGDMLIGFEENSSRKGAHRQYKHSEVVSAGKIIRPCYRVYLDDGTCTVSSAEHRWLVTTAGRRSEWKATENLKTTDHIFRLTNTWEANQSYAAGFLAAAFDGEGSLSHTGGKSVKSAGTSRSLQLNFAQKDNAMLASVKKFLTELGYRYSVYSYADGDVHYLVLRGGRSEIMRFLGEVRPPRLLEKFSSLELGTTRRRDDHPRVVKIEYNGPQEVIALETSTSTFIADGLASHNSYRIQWILEKGMFTTSERLDALGDKSMQEVVHAYHRTPLVAGIDVGRKQDKTIVTVVYVDWDNPDQFGLYYHQVLNWLDLEGMDWEEQYFRIVEFLSNYNIWKVGIDVGGLGDVVAQRMKILMPGVEVVELGSSNTDQSERWKYLKQLLDHAQISWPAGAKVRNLKRYKRFRTEMEDLEIHFKGPYVLAEAPKANDAHDDYPDSLAMACILSHLEGDEDSGQVEISSNVLYSRSRSSSGGYLHSLR